MRLKFEWDADLEEWTVTNRKKEDLGYIFYDPDWRELVWIQFEDVQMSQSCLQEIIKFMEKTKHG